MATALGSPPSAARPAPATAARNAFLAENDRKWLTYGRAMNNAPGGGETGNAERKAGSFSVYSVRVQIIGHHGDGLEVVVARAGGDNRELGRRMCSARRAMSGSR